MYNFNPLYRVYYQVMDENLEYWTGFFRSNPHQSNGGGFCLREDAESYKNWIYKSGEGMQRLYKIFNKNIKLISFYVDEFIIGV